MKNRTGVPMYLFLLLVIAIPLQKVNAEPAQWEQNIAAFETSDRAQPPPDGAILFVGSSSIVMWKTLAEDFAPMPVINRGFGGSQIEDSIHFADRIIIPYKPGIIVLYAGDNDIAAGKTPERVFADFRRFVETVRAKLPDTVIFFLSIKPSGSRWEMWEDMKKANHLIDRWCTRNTRLEYIDISPPMLDEKGMIRGDIFLEDNLHLNAEGYRFWTAIVLPRLVANY